MIDQPTKVRQGEELAVEKLGKYLATTALGWSGDIEVLQFPSGFSNLTFFLKIGDTELVLRRPPFGVSAKGGHDMFREYRIMRDLYTQFLKVPKVFHYCEDKSILGAPFYLMERVKGVILRSPTHPNHQQLTKEAYQQIATSWLDTFVDLHQIDYQQAGLGDFGRPEGYVERQIMGWSKRYEKSKTSEVKAIEKVIAWLNKAIPKESAHALIHNDYKYDNIVFQEHDWTTVKAILDWEMATIGDPLFDLGTSIAYWINPDDLPSEQQQAMLPTFFEGNPTRGEIIHQYALKSGSTVGNFVYPYVYGLFKITVIVQQIFYRYQKGYTKDKRFAHLDQMAEFLCVKALQAIQKQRIDQLF